MVQYWVRSYMSSPAWDYQATAVRNASEIIPRVKRVFESAIRYVQYLVVKPRGLRDERVKLRLCLIISREHLTTGDERELSFSDICVRRTHSSPPYAGALSKNTTANIIPQRISEKKRQRERCEVIKKKRADVSPGSFALSGIRHLLEQREIWRIQDLQAHLTSRRNESRVRLISHAETVFSHIFLFSFPRVLFLVSLKPSPRVDFSSLPPMGRWNKRVFTGLNE